MDSRNTLDGDADVPPWLLNNPPLAAEDPPLKASPREGHRSGSPDEASDRHRLWPLHAHPQGSDAPLASLQRSGVASSFQATHGHGLGLPDRHVAGPAFALDGAEIGDDSDVLGHLFDMDADSPIGVGLLDEGLDGGDNEKLSMLLRSLSNVELIGVDASQQSAADTGQQLQGRFVCGSSDRTLDTDSRISGAAHLGHGALGGGGASVATDESAGRPTRASARLWAPDHPLPEERPAAGFRPAPPAVPWCRPVAPDAAAPENEYQQGVPGGHAACASTPAAEPHFLQQSAVQQDPFAAEPPIMRDRFASHPTAPLSMPVGPMQHFAFPHSPPSLRARPGASAARAPPALGVSLPVLATNTARLRSPDTSLSGSAAPETTAPATSGSSGSAPRRAGAINLKDMLSQRFGRRRASPAVTGDATPCSGAVAAASGDRDRGTEGCSDAPSDLPSVAEDLTAGTLSAPPRRLQQAGSEWLPRAGGSFFAAAGQPRNAYSADLHMHDSTELYGGEVAHRGVRGGYDRAAAQQAEAIAAAVAGSAGQVTYHEAYHWTQGTLERLKLRRRFKQADFQELMRLASLHGAALRISRERFEAYQGAIGQIARMLHRVRDAWDCTAPTFIAGPALLRHHAEALLCEQPQGTAVLRLSLSCPGDIALAVKRLGGAIEHWALSLAELERHSLQQLLAIRPAISHVLDPATRSTRTDKRALMSSGYIAADALLLG